MIAPAASATSRIASSGRSAARSSRKLSGSAWKRLGPPASTVRHRVDGRIATDALPVTASSIARSRAAWSWVESAWTESAWSKRTIAIQSEGRISLRTHCRA